MIHRRPPRALWCLDYYLFAREIECAGVVVFFPYKLSGGFCLVLARGHCRSRVAGGAANESLYVVCVVPFDRLGLVFWFGLFVPGGLVYCRCLGAVFRAWQANLNLWWSCAGTSPWFVLA